MWWLLLVLDYDSHSLFESDPPYIYWLLQSGSPSWLFAFSNTCWSRTCLFQNVMFEILWGADYFLRIICIIVLHNVKLRYILQKSILLYKWMVNSHPWGLCLPIIHLLINWTESVKNCYGILIFAQPRFSYFDAIMDMTSSILCKHSNIVVFYVLL